MSAPARICRMCERPSSVRPITRHHLVPKAFFRDMRARNIYVGSTGPVSNIIPLCRPCHDLIDCQKPKDRRRFRRMLRRRLTSREIDYACRMRGLAWLDMEYPPSPPERDEATIVRRAV